MLALTVWDWQCLEDSEQKDDWLNDWITVFIGAYRTAPATPGLLNTHCFRHQTRGVRDIAIAIYQGWFTASWTTLGVFKILQMRYVEVDIRHLEPPFTRLYFPHFNRLTGPKVLLDYFHLQQKIDRTRHKIWLCIQQKADWRRNKNWLIQVKEEGWTGFSSSWQGWSSGFSLGFALGKSLGAALTALRKSRPSLPFYLDLHSI